MRSVDAKIDRALQQLLRDAQDREPDRAIPVIVTVVPGCDLDLLAQRGLEIGRTFSLISAVSGTVRAADVRRLSRLDAVVRIEHDGPISAC